MSFSLNLLFFFGIYFISEGLSQNNENETLIYGWDVHHRRNYYCLFASQAQIKMRSIEMECFKRNPEMTHILPDGTKTHPYLPYGSPEGFILKCGDIPRGILQPGCNRSVYTSCTYTCETGGAVHKIKCNLMGPFSNVTAQWSIKEPCAEASTTRSLITPDPDVQLFIEGNYTVGLTGSSSTSQVTDATTANSTELMTSVPSGEPSDNKLKIIAASVIVGVFAASVMGFVIWWLCKGKSKKEFIAWCLRKRKNKQKFISDRKCEENGILGQNNQQTPFLPPDHQEHETLDEPLDAIQVDENSNNQPTENINGLGQEPPYQGHADLGIAELGLSDRFDYGVSDNMMFKSKASVGSKMIRDAFDDISSLDCDSLEKNIHIGEVNGTVTFSKASKGKNLLIEDPDVCNATIALLRDQTNSYRKRLRPELEVIPGRSREQALIGYMEENAQALDHTRNGIKLLEKTYESKVEEKVSDEFLQILAAWGVKIGSIIKYFYTHGNKDAIEAILEVHKECEFCAQFKN